MSRGPQTFRQRDVVAALKAAKLAGLAVLRVEIDKAGKIVIVAGDPETNQIAQDGVPQKEINPWDAVLKTHNT